VQQRSRFIQASLAFLDINTCMHVVSIMTIPANPNKIVEPAVRSLRNAREKGFKAAGMILQEIITTLTIFVRRYFQGEPTAVLCQDRTLERKTQSARKNVIINSRRCYLHYPRRVHLQLMVMLI
jgi:hypothetical protein